MALLVLGALASTASSAWAASGGAPRGWSPIGSSGPAQRIHSIRAARMGEQPEPSGYPLAHQDLVAVFHSEGQYNLAGLPTWNGRPVTETNKPGERERRLAAAIRLYVPKNRPNILYVQINHVVTTENAYWAGTSFQNVTQTGVRFTLPAAEGPLRASPAFSSELANPEEILLDGNHSCNERNDPPLTTTPGYELTQPSAGVYQIHTSNGTEYGLGGEDFFYVCGENRIQGGAVYELAFPPGTNLRSSVNFAAAKAESEYGAGNQFIEATALPIPNPTETTPPVVSCGLPDTVWHSQNASVACTASDPEGPGLANPSSESGFNVNTTLSAGQESATAATEKRWICDVAENCTAAGPVGPFKVDRKAPTVISTYPTEGALIPAGSSQTSEFSCVDTGSGLASCESPEPNLETETSGQHTLLVRGSDAVGNTETTAIHYTVGAPAECSSMAQLCQVGLGDTTPPALQSVALSPTAVDTSQEPRTVTISVGETDDLSGVAAVQANLSGQGVWLTAAAHLQSGGEQSGTWQAAITLPAGSPQGAYALSISTYDHAGNTGTFQPSELSARGFPTGVTQFAETKGIEYKVPELLAFSVAPTAISTCTSAHAVQVSAHLSSSVGAGAARVVLSGPNGQRTIARAALNEGNGTPTNGTWVATASLPRYAAQGKWSISLIVTDNTGAETYFSSSQLEALPAPGSIEQTCPGDTEAPTATAVTLAPEEVNTAGAAREVSITVHATDNLSGIATATATLASGHQSGTANLALEDGGTSTNGTWTGTVKLPRYSAQGLWGLTLKLADKVGNSATVSPSQLQGAGLSSGIDQTGPGDSTPPTVNGGSVSPSAIDSSASPAAVLVTLHTIDLESGVARAFVRFTSHGGRQVSGWATEQSDGGSPQEDNWGADLTFPRFSEEGEWFLTLELWDNFGSERTYSSSELAALGIFETFFVGHPPAVNGVAPPYGLDEGANKVTITGTELGTATEVKFGTSLASFTINSSKQITATAPAAASPKTVDITVTTPYGTSAVGSADRYGYVAAGSQPTVRKLSVGKGPAAGGTSVTIAGADLYGPLAVDFGTTPASAVFEGPSGTVIAIAPPGTSGTVDVRVTTPNGTTEATPADKFTYELPTITSLTPTSGPQHGGTVVTILGSGFAVGSETEFMFKKVAGTETECPTTERCIVTTPTYPGKGGTVEVTAEVGKYKSAKRAGYTFTFVPPPAIKKLSPKAGPASGGTSVSITGANLANTSAVTFGGTAASAYKVESAGLIVATAPTGTTGTVDVQVMTASGTSPISTKDQYKYTP